MAESASVCVILIGDELLSGRTQDQNLTHLARLLGEHGLQIGESRIIPDQKEVIVETVRACQKRFHYLITTGGIGPTHDDITVDAIAAALHRKLIMHPEIEAMIRSREVPEEQMRARLRMARVPEGAELVRSGTGPPGFRIENIFVLAGIPRVMQSMADAMVKMMKGGQLVHSKTVDAFLYESELAIPLEAVQERYPEISIGSYPFYREQQYGANLVLRSRDEIRLEAAFKEVQAMVRQLEQEKQRAG